MKNKSFKNQKGFTMIELLIATTVFSMVMLIASSGLIYIGRIYYKGIITAKTQEASRSIVDELTRQIQFSAGDKYTLSSQQNYSSTITGVKIQAVCLGDMKYTWVVAQPKIKMAATDAPDDTQSPALQHLMWADKMAAAEACTASSYSLASRDLLAQGMRLTSFGMSKPPASTVVTINLSVYYGDYDLTESNDGLGACKGSSSGGQFCARSELAGVVASSRIVNNT